MNAAAFVLSLIVMLLATLCSHPTHAQIPPQAIPYLPTVRAQLNEVWPSLTERHYLPALIEHESCITLTHPKCWNPGARLRTQREEGAGFGQLTRAFNTNGTTRFDALADVRRLDPIGLNDLRWETIYQRADLQIRAIILMSRANWNQLQKLTDHPLPFTDAAYNGGLRGVMNERRACAMTPRCDPDQWFGHVENQCLKSRRPLYGSRSACDINRHHVADVLLKRMPKYQGAL